MLVPLTEPWYQASQMANNVDVAGMRTREVLNRLMIRRTKTTKAVRVSCVLCVVFTDRF
jgi:hypothetical protein